MNTIVLDWLQLSLNQKEEPQTTKNFTVVASDTIALYDRGYQVFYKNYPLTARIYCGLLNHTNKATIKFENWVFYRQFSINEFLNDFWREMPFEFDHLQRVDFALDCDEIKPCGLDIQQFIKRVLAGEIKRDKAYNRSSITAYQAKTQVSSRREFETIYFQKSGVMLKLYNKTNELKASGKDYIEQYWLLADPEHKKPVWRAEFKLLGETLKLLEVIHADKLTGEVCKELKLYDGFNYDDLEFVKGVFWQLVKNYYFFVFPSIRPGPPEGNQFYAHKNLYYSPLYGGTKENRLPAM